MSDTVVAKDAVVSYSLIDTNVVVGEGAKVGGEVGCAEGITVLGEGTVIEAGAVVAAGDMIPELRKERM